MSDAAARALWQTPRRGLLAAQARLPVVEAALEAVLERVHALRDEHRVAALLSPQLQHRLLRALRDLQRALRDLQNALQRRLRGRRRRRHGGRGRRSRSRRQARLVDFLFEVVEQGPVRAPLLLQTLEFLRRLRLLRLHLPSHLVQLLLGASGPLVGLPARLAGLVLEAADLLLGPPELFGVGAAAAARRLSLQEGRQHGHHRRVDRSGRRRGGHRGGRWRRRRGGGGENAAGGQGALASGSDRGRWGRRLAEDSCGSRHCAPRAGRNRWRWHGGTHNRRRLHRRRGRRGPEAELRRDDHRRGGAEDGRRRRAREGRGGSGRRAEHRRPGGGRGRLPEGEAAGGRRRGGGGRGGR
mmetsp:Transcript_158373/g.507975  ORF Transcript_158373/g.507975 Transcript_158373/m.507975 type:complete len:355 (-) Transcript_158373:2374-3438(-)